MNSASNLNQNQLDIANDYIQLYRTNTNFKNSEKMQDLELGMDEDVVEYIESVLGEFCFS